MSILRDNGRVLVSAVLVAAGIVAGGLWMTERNLGRAAAGIPAAATPEYGRHLLRDTARYLGPGLDDPGMRYSGSHLACASCHLDIGTRPGTLSLLQTAGRYPRESGRDGGVRDLRDRINGCMTRSMNGRELPRDSVEMIAMEQYIVGLSDQYGLMSAARKAVLEPAEFVEPDRAANPAAGERVYADNCAVCHGDDGAGLAATANRSDGYVFPPLWGPDSFNNGAGMNRVLTAARFIKARMPFGRPDLSDDEAFDVAAYINSQPRPEKADLESDYPDLTTKPIDSPYPPYADDFPHEQHKYGPYRPIREYYDRQKGMRTI